MKTIAWLFSYFISMLILAGLYSCQKIEFPDPSTLPKGLQGYWVETSKGADTIIFYSNKDTGSFYLTRGKNFLSGDLLSTTCSPSYTYIIKPDTIYIVDVLSGSYLGRNYYFNFYEPSLTIQIEKFCKYIDVKKSILTFRKIK